MKIFLTDQSHQFTKHLEDEKQKKVMRYDKAHLKELAETAQDTVAPYRFTITKKQFKEFKN